jgi:hypothetical protein
MTCAQIAIMPKNNASEARAAASSKTERNIATSQGTKREQCSHYVPSVKGDPKLWASALNLRKNDNDNIAFALIPRSNNDPTRPLLDSALAASFAVAVAGPVSLPSWTLGGGCYP